LLLLAASCRLAAKQTVCCMPVIFLSQDPVAVVDLTQESDEEMFPVGSTGHSTQPSCAASSAPVAVTDSPVSPSRGSSIGQYDPCSTPPPRVAPPPLIRLRLPSCRYQCGGTETAEVPPMSNGAHHCGGLYGSCMHQHGPSVPWGQGPGGPATHSYPPAAHTYCLGEDGVEMDFW
jgi:hypothetical protein